MKRKQVKVEYTPQLAANLDNLARALGLPLKAIRTWRKEWLSYPVTAEEFNTLVIIANFVWRREDLIKSQLAQKSHADKARIIRAAGVPKPIVFLRNELLRRRLMGYRYLPTKKLMELIRGHYPSGCRLIDKKVLRAAKKWAQDQDKKTAHDPRARDLLIKSLNLVIGEAGKLVYRKRTKQKPVREEDDFLYSG